MIRCSPPLRGGLVVFCLSLASVGCDSCRSDESPVVSAEVADGSGEQETRLVIEQLVRRHAGEPLSTVAVHVDGRVALFGQSGAFVVTAIEQDLEDPPTQRAASAVMAAGWLGEVVVGLETSPAALTLWNSEAEQLSSVALDGEAVDLWVDAPRGVVWTLTRVGPGAEVRAHVVGSDGFEPRLTHAIGGQPVGLYADENSIFAPTFLDRTITEFSADDIVWRASTPVNSRPLLVHPLVDGFAVVGASADAIEVIGSAGTVEVAMAQPQWIEELDGRTYAFTPGDSVLRRLAPDSLEEQGSTSEFGLVSGVTMVESGLIVLDAGTHPSISLVDPESFELLAGRVAEGRPATIVATGPSSFLVVSPAEGMVTTYRVVAQ